MKKRSTFSWVLEFAGRKKSFYLGSVLIAILGVATSSVPYLIIADVVGKLLSGSKDVNYYLKAVVFMVVCWVLRVTFHSVSTTLSHVATFNVLGGIRKQLCKKLSTIPLGSVLDDNSGSYKNIIVERVDSMETTLAHIVPEFTANILLPAIIFIYLLTIDWRVGLDEATANVDPENEKELTKAIENLTKEKTIIMIAHRLKTVRNADRIFVIDKGRIVQQGKHDELMQQNGIYKTFVSGRKQAVSWKIA